MATWEEANRCKKNNGKNHSFVIKYKRYNYCEFCGDCQALGGFPISEDLLEHLKEEHDIISEQKPKIVILDDNELSIAKYAEEYPENFKKIGDGLSELSEGGKE